MLFFLQIKVAEIEGLNEPLLPLVLFPFFFLPLSIPKMFHVKHFASSFLKIVSRETIERGCDKIR